jgi:hypothetical protein
VTTAILFFNKAMLFPSSLDAELEGVFDGSLLLRSLR